MDHGDSEFRDYEKVGGCYDVIDGVKEKYLIFSRLELMLDGYSTYFRTEK